MLNWNGKEKKADTYNRKLEATYEHFEFFIWK